jgi:glycosyltransferase involved in cell wall biosynthesis
MDLGSCREVIEDGVTGFLVNDVAGALKALEAMPSVRDVACRRRVEDRFSIATMVEAYARVYATILELHPSKG